MGFGWDEYYNSNGQWVDLLKDKSSEYYKKTKNC